MTIQRYQSTASEPELLAAVQGAIAGRRGRSVHIRDARRQNVTGLPDVLGVVPLGDDPDGPHLLLGVEIKTARDRRRSEQDDWLRRLNLVTASAGVILRAGQPKHPDEIGLDDVLALIAQGAMR